MTPQRYLLAGALTLAALSASAADLVRLGNLKFAHYGAVSYMKELAPKYNLKIDERVFAKGIDIIPAIVAGEIDIAASAADGAIAGRAAGAPIYVVAGFSKGGVRFVSRKGAGIQTLADLKGKKVGVARGGTQEMLLLAELAKAGLSWSDKPGKDVLVLYMPYADLNQAMLAGSIDAMSQSEPQAAQAINKGFGVELLKPYDTPIGEPVRTLVMTEKMYKEKPDVALRVMKLFVEATRTFIDKPQLAEQYVRQTMFKNQISAEDYKDAMGNARFSYSTSVKEIQTNTDMMKRYGVGKMTQPPKAADWVKLDLLQKAEGALKTGSN
ncbi:MULTISPECIES: ABC transporter substrate-binding protein [Microvirgula]|uniref:ABC transporter substrate-binding protein n=1 Tax=Microvirgula TaxID=57479 RepID=UPI00055CE9B6|nr:MULTISPECIES: ABC transporter substrate-binding protein [Microvirgula]RAS19106.1 NitT/TauT family transport system substrate-binding protein [Microvirgula sp. AG722]